LNLRTAFSVLMVSMSYSMATVRLL
jgi:hypothetical protein